MVPINPGHNLTKSQSPSDPQAIEEMKRVPYREAVGSLMYVVVGTWLDIAYSILPGQIHGEPRARTLGGSEACHKVSKRNQGCKTDPRKRQHAYLGRTQLPEPSRMQGYSSDADRNSQEHCHVISSYVFCIDGGEISGNSRKKALVSLSTMESEYIAMMHTTKEALWIWMFLGKILRPLTKPMLLYCDNQSAITVEEWSVPHMYQAHWYLLSLHPRDGHPQHSRNLLLPHQPDDCRYFHEGVGNGQ